MNVKRAKADAAGFAGRFFYDGERGDIGWIAKKCDDRQCDCERKVNADGDQDCSHSLSDWEGEDHICEPIVRMLNGYGEAIAEIDRLNAYVAHNDEEYRTMKEVLRAEHAECQRLRGLLVEACDIGERYVKDAWPTIQSWDGTRLSAIRHSASEGDNG